MKKTIYLLASVIAASALVSSCEKYLDVESYIKDMTQYDSVFVKRTTTEQWLWNSYNYLAHLSSISSGAFWYASDDVIFNDETNNCQRYQNGEYSASNQLWEDRYSNVYVGIRVCSQFIHNVYKCTEVSARQREQMEGEARFLRAFYYFNLFKQYGPVPIVPDEGQDLSMDYNELALPRATVDDLVDFMVADLDRAANVLPLEYASTYLGRATQGAALALKAKILLYAASPLYNGNTELFNMKNSEGEQLIPQVYDESKWARAAAAAKEVIDLGEYELFTVRRTSSTAPLPSAVPSGNFPNGAGNIDPYESYTQLFNGETPLTVNNEFIFFRQGSVDVNNFVWKAFPRSHNGSNCMGATWKQVEAYYMADGRDPENASEEYPLYKSGYTDALSSNRFVPIGSHRMWLDREPRFYASISFNNCIWENATADQSLQNVNVNYYRSGADGKTLSRPSNYPLTGIGVKKYYNPDDSWDEGGRRTHKPMPVIRYADVLLWYAEALNELSDGKVYSFDNTMNGGEPVVVSRNIDEIRNSIKRIRIRAGLPDFPDADYETRDLVRTRIKRERQVELFMEGQRYWDLRRWKDAKVEENAAVMGLNVEMKASGSQRDRFYEVTPTQITKVFMDKMNFWPFSQVELDKNIKLTQNPGY